jgi:GR25 family glycosyltransferase involved in LPS biosynthesis
MFGLPNGLHKKTITPETKWTDCVDMFIYINLAHRVDRNEQMQNLFKQLNIPPQKITRLDAIKDAKGYRGCTKSHLKAIELAISKNYKYVCLMEDDLQLVTSVEKVHTTINSAWTELKSTKWDIIYLAMTPIRLVRQRTKGFHRVLAALAMPAMIIPRDYMPTLKQIYEQSLEQDKPHDLLTQLHQPADQWYGFFPPLMRQSPGFSDIENREVDYRRLEIDGIMMK